MERILYITKHNPWGVGGGCFASRMYFQTLREVFRNYKIDFLYADTCKIPSDLDLTNLNLIPVGNRFALSKILSCVTGITHRYQNKAIELLKENQYTYAVFDHSSIAGTLLKHLPSTTRSIVIHHNFEPDYFADNTSSLILRKLLLPSVRKNERRAYLNCNLNIFLTKEDLEQFRKEYGENAGRKNIVTGLISTSDFHICPNVQPESGTIVISGSLDNVQNTDAVFYFIDELYPEIPANYKTIIAGKNPSDEIKQKIAGKRIELIANPTDMASIISQGSIYVCPARLGSGIKVRIADGLRIGLPVIAHNVSARGYGEFIDRGYMLSFSTPEEFRNGLLKFDSSAQKYSRQGISDLFYNLTDFRNIANKIEQQLQ